MTSLPTGAPAPRSTATIELRWGTFPTYIDVKGTPTTIGRGIDNHIAFDEPHLSKQHVEVWYDGQLWVSDCDSKNGTTLDGVAVSPREPVAVPPGACLILGGVVEIRLLDEDPWSWALAQLPDLARARSPRARLKQVVGLATAMTGAPVVYALRWHEEQGRASVLDLVHSGETAEVPGPEEVSRSVLTEALAKGPIWTDHARQDARLQESQSVFSQRLRVVGCVPIASGLALYLSDRQATQLWPPRIRWRLEALGRLVGALEDATVAAPAPASSALPGMVGASQVMQDLADQIDTFAPFRGVNVLILGEPGTGKTRLARAIHDRSGATGQFVHVHVPSLRQELLESQLFGYEPGAFTGATRSEPGHAGHAQDGTLFLDEIGDLSEGMQCRLLQLLRERTYCRLGSSEVHRFTGRLIAATNRPIDDRESEPTFRRDLFVRLAEAQIRVPGLAQRREDIPALIRRFVDEFVSEHRSIIGDWGMTVSPGVISWLAAGDVSDNLAGLRSQVRIACMSAHRHGREVRIEHLADPRAPIDEVNGIHTPTADYRRQVDDFERTLILQAMDDHAGNRSATARALGLSRSALGRCIHRLGIVFDDS